MPKFNIVNLNYVTLYPADHVAALAYYTQVFGPLDREDPNDGVWGWRMVQPGSLFSLANMAPTQPGIRKT